MKERRQFVRWEMKLPVTVLLAATALGSNANAYAAESAATSNPLAWPEATRECRPWAYWWWMGSAVDPANLTRELQRYRDAGMGGVHIIPIYGAKGCEEKYIDYLTPKWMERLRHTVTEAQRLGLGVDMTTGTGWCFGGPNVTDEEANALAVVKTFDIAAGGSLQEKFNRQGTHAIVAFSSEGQGMELTAKINAEGAVDWTAEGGPWRVYAVSQRPSGQKVKRAAPGGEGPMLNLIYAAAMRTYLRRFEEAFAKYPGPKPRAMYHDSYEYRSDWSPDFFAQFEKRRGYRLQTELPALFGKEENDHVARLKCDYRETVSDVMVEESLPLWASWSRAHGFLTRNQAHGSPGNLLDLYAVADIPETEMFNEDRNKLVSKFASSAAHVTGKRLVASETGTWLKEHFTETLADLKYLLDDLFASGVNHVIYHGTCYSPDEAAWPGWLFYASTEMNPRNAIWHDVPALNACIARCQSVLQSGQPDNDLLLYWPIHDRWHNAQGRGQNFSVHARDWLEGQSIGKAAERLWNRGFAFDYVSDRQLAQATAVKGRVEMPGGTYRLVVIPACSLIPLKTLENLLTLARSGATVVFEDHLPKDVPGLSDLEMRRAEFRNLLDGVMLTPLADGHLKEARPGAGRVLVGDLEPALNSAGVAREPMVDHAGLLYLRRAFEGGRHYFIANRGEQPLDGWTTLATAAQSAAIMDPMTGRAGVAAMRQNNKGQAQVYLQLRPGASVILRTFANPTITGPAWTYWQAAAPPVELAGTWQVEFLQGGPQLPPPFQAAKLASWTELGGEEAQRFAGTARYTLRFDAPAQSAGRWLLDLGKVCQSARALLNGVALGIVFVPPFQIETGQLKPRGNVLEVEVTNVSANRIRDLDRRQVAWKNFRDINFVNLDYKPFDATNWPLTESGLLGPVRLIPMVPRSTKP